MGEDGAHIVWARGDQQGVRAHAAGKALEGMTDRQTDSASIIVR